MVIASVSRLFVWFGGRYSLVAAARADIRLARVRYILVLLRDDICRLPFTSLAARRPREAFLHSDGPFAFRIQSNIETRFPFCGILVQF